VERHGEREIVVETSPKKDGTAEKENLLLGGKADGRC